MDQTTSIATLWGKDRCIGSVSGPVERFAPAQLLSQLCPSRPRTAPPLACPLPAQPATSLPPPSRLSRGDESPIKRPGSPRRRHHQPAGRRLHCFALIGGQELAGANERRLLVGR